VTERRLYLVRHAKSSWKEAGIADHDRPLAPRGKRASKAMAAWLREHRVVPEMVLCSTATRAQQTFKRLDLAPRHLHVERELYGADAATILARLRDVPGRIGSVMVIGHNPGLEDLTRVLTGDGLEKFPTGALAALVVRDRSWGDLERDGAELVDFVRPRDLD
jgi:phosphohistidine phosphatase